MASEETNRQSESFVLRLNAIFDSKAQYQQLLNCRDDQAQNLLDLFQEMLGIPEVDRGLKRNLIVASQRLSKKSGLYPTSYDLEDVQFRVDEPVAGGGFGDIYKGDFRGQAVCVKKLRRYEASRAQGFPKWAKEALLWGQLAHPNICPIFGLHRHNAQICFVSPWMDNGDVVCYLEKCPHADRVLLAHDAAQGLLYLHDNNIIHGDLKGANVLVSANGRACLTDFGLSSVSDADILAWASNSAAESRGGTLRWQAPELFKPENDKVIPNSKASDIYAWASFCYEMFAGHIPFVHIKMSIAVIPHVLAGNTPVRPPDSSLSWSSWGLTEPIWSMLMKCWKSKPSSRPTAKQAIEFLVYELRQDLRPADDIELFQPARFREGMASRLNTTSIDTLEHLIGTTPIPDSRSKGRSTDSSSAPRSPADRRDSIKLSYKTDGNSHNVDNSYSSSTDTVSTTGMKVRATTITNSLRNILPRQSSVGKKATYDRLKDKYEFMADPRESDLVIVLFGQSGTGKSTFINTLCGPEVAEVGHTTSVTTRVSHYFVPHPYYADRRIVLVDTPGFDHASQSDSDILERIGIWLANSYKAGMSLVGLIYMFSITAHRFTRSEASAYARFKALCGNEGALKAVFVTSKWDKLEDVREGEAVEKVLTEVFFSGMVKGGATMHRLRRTRESSQESGAESAKESARKILDSILSRDFRGCIAIQRELVDEKKDLTETAAWRVAVMREKAKRFSFGGWSRPW